MLAEGSIWQGEEDRKPNLGDLEHCVHFEWLPRKAFFCLAALTFRRASGGLHPVPQSMEAPPKETRGRTAGVAFRSRPLEITARLHVLRALDELESEAPGVSRPVAHGHAALDGENEEVRRGAMNSLPPVDPMAI